MHPPTGGWWSGGPAERNAHRSWSVRELAENPHGPTMPRPLERESASVEVGKRSRFSGRLGGEAGEKRPEQPEGLAIRRGLGIEHKLLSLFWVLRCDGAEHFLRELLHCPVRFKRGGQRAGNRVRCTHNLTPVLSQAAPALPLARRVPGRFVSITIRPVVYAREAPERPGSAC